MQSDLVENKNGFTRRSDCFAPDKTEAAAGVRNCPRLQVGRQP
jgi:hypothetical protein